MSKFNFFAIAAVGLAPLLGLAAVKPAAAQIASATSRIGTWEDVVGGNGASGLTITTQSSYGVYTGTGDPPKSITAMDGYVGVKAFYTGTVAAALANNTSSTMTISGKITIFAYGDVDPGGTASSTTILGNYQVVGSLTVPYPGTTADYLVSNTRQYVFANVPANTSIVLNGSCEGEADMFP